LQPSISQTQFAGFWTIDKLAHPQNQRPVIFRQQISAQKMFQHNTKKTIHLNGRIIDIFLKIHCSASELYSFMFFFALYNERHHTIYQPEEFVCSISFR
jgi:hypothetical protein